MIFQAWSSLMAQKVLAAWNAPANSSIWPFVKCLGSLFTVHRRDTYIFTVNKYISQNTGAHYNEHINVRERKYQKLTLDMLRHILACCKWLEHALITIFGEQPRSVTIAFSKYIAVTKQILFSSALEMNSISSSIYEQRSCGATLRQKRCVNY